MGSVSISVVLFHKHSFPEFVSHSDRILAGPTFLSIQYSTEKLTLMMKI